MPNEPDEEPELPLLQALGIALLLWLVLALLFVVAMYWLCDTAPLTNGEFPINMPA